MPRFMQGYRRSRKLTLKEVRAIQLCGLSKRDAAYEFGISEKCVTEVRTGRYEVKHKLGIRL